MLSYDLDKQISPATIGRDTKRREDKNMAQPLIDFANTIPLGLFILSGCLFSIGVAMIKGIVPVPSVLIWDLTTPDFLLLSGGFALILSLLLIGVFR